MELSQVSTNSKSTQAFAKYVGAGNDFIIIDDRSLQFSIDPVRIAHLCHRQNGIGADGLILLQPSHKAHYTMRIFNCDGSEAEMCGNGLRCLGQFLIDTHLFKNPTSIEIDQSLLSIEYQNEQIITHLGNILSSEWDIDLKLQNQNISCHLLNTGVPHAVVITDDTNLIHKLGSQIRFHPSFAPHGANATFVTPSQPHLVSTYERGVEKVTLACGTGVAAAAIALAKNKKVSCPAQLTTPSGDILSVTFKENYDQITLAGPAHRVFVGEITY
ncbi:MAG: diaminopimelate epimerase [Parachlamydiales bacterium]|nr:diaminopimelate epimerase [Parachlamydiales bacterium]